jgi:hypothetical protein
VADGSHPGIDEDLADGILGSLVFLSQIGGMHGLDEIQWMVVGDKLQAVGNRIDEIILFYGTHDFSSVLCFVATDVVELYSASGLK